MLKSFTAMYFVFMATAVCNGGKERTAHVSSKQKAFVSPAPVEAEA